MSTLSHYQPGSILLLAGTKQGLFLLSSADRQHWQIERTQLASPTARIYYAVFDARNHYRIFAADNEENLTTYLYYSDTFGQSWQATAGWQFAPHSGLTLRETWYVEPGRADEPETLYAGTDMACLWTTQNYGQSWQANEALLSYPGRTTWGAGLTGTCLHSIIADYTNKERLWVSISGAGTLRSDDNGQSWQTLNTMREGEAADVGTNSHRLLQHPTQPAILYQQSKNGVFQSLDGGAHWQSILGNLPSAFGFPLAFDPWHPETLFTVVVDADSRYNLGEQFSVYRTENAGQHWDALTRGLPKGPDVRMKVLRHALCTDTKDPCGIYVGTMSGELFASADRGENWQLIAEHLPPIYSVTATIYR